MTIDATVVVAICMGLFGVCVGLGAYIARSVINRVGNLEDKQAVIGTDATALSGRVLRVEGELRVLEGKKHRAT